MRTVVCGFCILPDLRCARHAMLPVVLPITNAGDVSYHSGFCDVAEVTG